MKHTRLISYCATAMLATSAAIYPARRALADVVLDSTAHACYGCSEAQILNIAQSYGAGKHYIYDLLGNAIHLVNVTSCEPGFNGTITCINGESTVPTDVASAFASYHSAWNGNAQSEAFSGDVNYFVPSGNPVGSDHQPQDNGDVNAYDTLVGGSYQTTLTHWMEDPSHYSGFMAELISALNNLPTTDFAGLSLTITVHFSDGSKRTFTYTPGVKAFVPVRGTAIDAHNNPLPEAPPAIAQYFYFGGLPGFAPYDQRNVVQLLPGAPPSLPSEGCAEEKWDGHAITCVLPQ